MPDGLLDELVPRLGNPRARFVFPSEIAAASTLVAALEASGRTALPARRFIGWDAFKSEVFEGGMAGRPASKAIRAIFSRALAADNARSPFLRSVVPPQAAKASLRFAPSIASALPALAAVPEGPGDHLADWREIRRRYEGFLAERGLYEAGWLGRRAGPVADEWVLVYPDLTEDWDAYAEAALALPGSTAFLSERLGGGYVPAARFGTVVEEMRAVLLAIRAAVEAGTDPAGIAVSVAAPDSALPILEREAAVAGVRLDAREGRPLSESAGGRLLADAVALARSRMSFDALRRLLLDSSRPWKEKEAARRLLGVGIRKHVVAPLPEGEDVWEASIGGDDEARRLYRGLRTACRRIADAPGFSSLRSAFDSFRRAFIDEEAWSPAQDDEIARCVAVLDELEEAASAAGLPPDSVPGAADAFAEQLACTRYLPVSASGGIPVYRFPVAAGAMPDLHFVVNLAQGAAAAAARPLSFLRADERDRLGASDRDISSGLVRLLAISGKRVFLSYSEDGPDGVRPPHPAIDARSAEEAGLGFDRDRWLPNLEADARPCEAVFPSQAACAAAALVTAFGPRGADWTRGTPGSPATMGARSSAAVRSALSPEGPLRLSATAIEDYGACAFRRVFLRHLGVEAVESGLSFIDDRLLGRIYHDAFRRLLGPLREARRSVVAPSAGGQGGSGGPGEDGAAGETARPGPADVLRAIREAVAEVGRDKGPMAGILVETIEPALRRNFTRAAANLLSALDGQIPVIVDDAELRAPLAAIGAELIGRPDLLCVAASDAEGRRAVIVDYKKSRLPTRGELEPAEDGSVADIQIPAYTALAKAAGFEPESAYYLSIEGSEPSGKGRLLVYGPGPNPAVPEEKRGLLEPALLAAAARTSGVIGRGDVFVPAARDREAVCAGCDLRPVCRAHYAVR
ncbi:MAG: PD-(D/E)XK nuclease family protein [Spirochaetes bacterium]|nr:PD-(D/E)XK nuclease family protein [Spirochaetota bacterium]